MTNERDAAAAEPCLVVGSADGTLYATPQSVVEGYRLSDEQRTALEAQLAAAGADDTEGHQYIGKFGQLNYAHQGAHARPLPQYNPNAPFLGGWDGVGLRYIQPTYSGRVTRHEP